MVIIDYYRLTLSLSIIVDWPRFL